MDSSGVGGQVEPELSTTWNDSSAVALEGEVVDSSGVVGFFDSSFVEMGALLALCEAPLRAITHSEVVKLKNTLKEIFRIPLY